MVAGTTVEENKTMRLDTAFYIAVRDQNRSTVVTEVGPKSLTLQAHQNFVSPEPRPYKKLRPGQYCDVKYPVKKDAQGNVIKDEYGQAVLGAGEERRLGPDSFPIYHGEECGDAKNEQVLNNRQAMHLRARVNFVDKFDGENIPRNAGDEWLVRGNRNYIHPIETEIVAIIDATVVPENKYAVVLSPFDPATKKNRSGKQKVIAGSDEFFLEPGESLNMNPGSKDGLWDKHCLGSFDGLYVQALETFTETVNIQGVPTEVERIDGTSWTVYGPQTYVPSNHIKVKDPVKAISLGTCEGIYVKNLKEPDPTKSVRLVSGKDQSCIILEPWEELWDKCLPQVTELTIGLGSLSFARFSKDPSYKDQIMEKGESFLREDDEQWRAVVLRVPSNAIAEIIDYSTGKPRYIYGFDMTMLEPWEEVTILELSGGTPKAPKELLVAYKTLGPDFMHDEVIVSTSDHARVKVTMSHKWQIPISYNPEDDKKIFSMLDCIGYATDEIASIIRGAAATHNFDDFHGKAATIIREAVFGDDKIYKLEQNGMEIIGIDIKEVNPVDDKIAENLKEAVKTNIGIELDAKKAEAQAKAKRKAIENQMELDSATHLQEMQKEEKKKEFLELQATNEMTVQTDKAKASVAAKKIESDAELAHIKAFNDLEKDRLLALAAALGKDGASQVEASKETAKGLSGAGGEGKIIMVPYGTPMNLHHHEGKTKEH